MGDPTAAHIRVMTVHQSKGLQFGVVVLPELHSRLAGLPDSFVVGRPNPTAAVDTVCRYADSSTQALMPPQFQRIFRDHKCKLGELLCVLYCGAYLAEHALHMLIPPSTKSEKVALAGGRLAARAPWAPLPRCRNRCFGKPAIPTGSTACPSLPPRLRCQNPNRWRRFASPLRAANRCVNANAAVPLH